MKRVRSIRLMILSLVALGVASGAVMMGLHLYLGPRGSERADLLPFLIVAPLLFVLFVACGVCICRRVRALYDEKTCAETFLHGVIDSMNEPLLVVDRSYRVILANQTARQLASRARLGPGFRCHELTHHSDVPCDQNGELCPVAEAIQSGKPATQEHRHMRPDGSRQFVEVTAWPVLDEQGEVIHIIEHVRDVSRRVAAEERQRRLTRAIEAAADAVVLTDRDGKIIQVNPAFTRLTGYTAEEAIGQTPRLLKSGYQAPETYEELWKTITAGKCWGGLLVNRRKDGNTYHASLTVSPVMDQKGNVEGFVGIHRDISTQIALEEELHATNEALSEALRRKKSATLTLEKTLDELKTANSFQNKMLQTAATAIFTVDTNQRITGVNEAFEHITGYSEADVLGKPCSVLRGEPCARECRLFGAAFTDRVFRQQCTIHAKDGRELVILKNADVYRDEGGRVVGGIESFVDVTSLIEARRLAEEASRSKSEFLANMSHEIRTPMTAILGFSETLLDPDLSEAERIDAIRTIRRNGEHLLQIINDILDLSKIEAGKLDVERIPCSPVQIAREVIELMRVRAEGKGIDLDLVFEGPLPERVQSDPTRLRQILVNLLGNAIKFTERGGVRLVVRLAGEDPRRPMLRFDVIDTGIGMNDDQMARLFRPFTQADTSTTRRFGGTGLGLTISKRLAKMLGGDITISSRLGQGSTFTLTIATGPLDGVKFVQQPDATDSEEAREQASDGARPAVAEAKLDCRILLAEDGRDNQRLISYFLRRAGARVEVVENGRLAVEAALRAEQAGEPFDVILMDMQMPELDGYGATAELRSRGYTRPIIALTANAMEGDREKCLQAGCDDFATKPVDRRKLLAAIVDQVGRIERRASQP